MDVVLLQDDILLFSKPWGVRFNLVSLDLCLFILWFNRKVRWALLKCFVIYFSEFNEKHPISSPFPVLWAKLLLNGHCIPLWLQNYSRIYVYVPELKIIPNKLRDPWDQIIHRDIKVYVWKSLKLKYRAAQFWAKSQNIFLFKKGFLQIHKYQKSPTWKQIQRHILFENIKTRPEM